MPAILVLLFVVVPIVEILVIIQVGQAIGAWWTVLLLVADSVLGAWLLRREGARTWRAFREALQAGRWPGDEVAQGAMVIVGGTLLLTPGFVTDVVGFILLVPVSRRVLSRTVRSRVKARVVGGPGPRRQTGRRGSTQGPSGETMDVEVVEIRREAWPPATDAPPGIDGGADTGDEADGRDDADAADGAQDEGAEPPEDPSSPRSG
jgi:UPF0716 protein FxsA